MYIDINYNEKSYRTVTSRLALALISSSMLLVILSAFQELMVLILCAVFEGPFSAINVGEDDARYILESIAGCAIYLSAFMIPVAIFRLLMRRHGVEPMRLGVRLPSETFLMIFAAIAIVMGAAEVNSILVSPIDFSWIYEDSKIDSPAKLIVAFVATALVPGFCEEFLFRGCVLSNLLPYGKTTAVIGSSVLFALMHGNPAQFFYTAAAGIVLGLVYVETGSVWPGTFIHIFNNFYSVLNQYIADNTSDSVQATRLIYVIELLVLVAGTVAGIILIVKRRGKLFENKGNGAVPTSSFRMEQGRTVRLFFNPAMITYFAIQLAEAGLVLVFALVASAFI